jgi:fumarate reductase flavoprotein subunit
MQDETKKMIARRGFLKSAVATGVAGIAASTLSFAQTPASSSTDATQPCKKKSWENPPEPIPDSKIVKTIDTDIVVVGAGIAGLAAAHGAAEAGAKVVVIEKAKGFSARGMHNGCIGTKVHKAEGADLDKEQIIAELVRWASNRVHANLIRIWAERSGEVFDHYIDLARANGLVVELDKPYADLPNYPEYRTPLIFRKPDEPPFGSEHRLVGLIEQCAKEKGVDIHYTAPAQQLIRDPKTGRITGVIAKEKGVGYVKFNAKKGVVLATGDYASNQEMVEAWCPRVKFADFFPYTPEGANTGDGINMALWAGGKIADTPHPPMFHGIPGLGTDLMSANQTWLHLNRNGVRYENEANPSQGNCNARMMQPGNKAWGIFDSRWAQDLKTLNLAIFGPVMEPPELLEDSVKKGLVLRANSIEELAKITNLPVENVVKSVAKYNKFAKDKKDTEYGKWSAFLFTIEQGPFYAVPVPVHMLTITGGLNVDPNEQVVDVNDNPMPGLYAVGNVAGNFFANDYPLIAPGISHGRCVTLGYLLGKRLAGELHKA